MDVGGLIKRIGIALRSEVTIGEIKGLLSETRNHLISKCKELSKMSRKFNEACELKRAAEEERCSALLMAEAYEAKHIELEQRIAVLSAEPHNVIDNFVALRNEDSKKIYSLERIVAKLQNKNEASLAARRENGNKIALLNNANASLRIQLDKAKLSLNCVIDQRDADSSNKLKEYLDKAECSLTKVVDMYNEQATIIRNKNKALDIAKQLSKQDSNELDKMRKQLEKSKGPTLDMKAPILVNFQTEVEYLMDKYSIDSLKLLGNEGLTNAELIGGIEMCKLSYFMECEDGDEDEEGGICSYEQE